MKKIYKKDINEMKELSKKMPKTINEAINFGDNVPEIDEYNDYEDEPEVETAAEPEVEVNASQKAEKLIDDIRKMSLKAMAELADTPEDKNYQMLKKIWGMTERKPEQEKTEQELR